MEQSPQEVQNSNKVEKDLEKEGRFLNKFNKVLRAGVAAAVVGIAAAPAQAQEAPVLGFESTPTYDSGSTPEYSTSSEYNYGGSAANESYRGQDGSYIITPGTGKKSPLSVNDQAELISNGGQDTSMQAGGVNDKDAKIRSALAKSAQDIKEWVEGGKSQQPLIIENPAELISKTAQGQALESLGGVGSIMGESVTQDPAKSHLSSELTEQILRSFSNTTEPSQILSLNEQLVMELERAAVKEVQIEINQDLKEKLQLAKKGEVTLEFASLTPNTKKIFIKFASGDETSVEVPTIYLGNKDLLGGLLITVIKQEILLETVGTGKQDRGGAMEPSQIITEEETSLMEREKATVDAIQNNVNQSLQQLLSASGKGNVTLQFASLSTDTKKIFITFTSGDKTSVDVNMMTFNDKRQLQNIVEATITQKVFSDAYDANEGKSKGE